MADWVANGIALIALIVSGVSISLSIKQNQRLNQQGNVDESRRFFVTLYDKIKDVSRIDPMNPIGPDVRTSINVMELVALCWEANIVDKRMVELSFLNEFIIIYEQINQTQVIIPGMNKTGTELLNGAPAIGRLYAEIKRLQTQQARI